MQSSNHTRTSIDTKITNSVYIKQSYYSIFCPDELRLKNNINFQHKFQIGSSEQKEIISKHFINIYIHTLFKFFQAK